MATHDYVISNASGSAVRADLNNALAAIVSNNSNATSPATTYAYQWWADTTTGQLKLRNSANNAWITIFELDGTMLMLDGSLAAPGLAFASDLDTGFSRSAANTINFSTGGAERLEIADGEVVFNDPSNDVDFRVESSGISHMLFVDAGNDRVGIGASAPGRTLDVNGIIRSDGTSGGLVFGGNSSTLSEGAAIHRPANNTLAFITDSTERLRIDSSGNAKFGAGSTITADVNADDLVIDKGAADTGLSILSTTTGRIYFGDAADDEAGSIRYVHSDNSMRFETASSEVLRIDSSGRLLINHTADAAPDAFESTLQLVDTSYEGSSMTIRRDVNTDAGPVFLFAKSRSGSKGGNTSVNSGDNVGRILFYAADGTDTNTRCAEIRAQIDGTPGSNDMPGRLAFYTTADGANSPTERVRLNSDGNLLVGLSATSNSTTARIVSRNDVDYTSTEFEDNATLLLNNEQNNNSAVLVFHSNDSGGSSGRSAIVGGTVNNGKGKLGFYGSCINKDSSTDADVTIDADGRLLVGNTSPQSTDSLIEAFKSSGANHIRVQTNSLDDGKFSMFRAYGIASGGGSTRQAYIGVYKHSSITQAAGFMMLEQEDGGNSYYWTDNLGKLRTSTDQNNIGTTGGTVIGTQTSDLRLKNVGANVSYGLTEVKQLQPKQYALKGDPDVNKLGFIAQDVESIIPEAVFDTNEELDGHQEGDRTKLGMDYVQLIPVLVNAIKELSAEVDTLKTKVAALEAG